MADPNAVGGPLWWLQRMETRLRARRWRTQLYDDYYSGRHRLAFATPKFREAFGGLFNELADDWCSLVVDAVDERMIVTGFRIGANAERGDKDAWAIWQANSLDAGSRMGHVESLIREESAAIVWYGDSTTNDVPKITVEAPDQCWVEFADSSRTTRAAALKLWTDDDGYEYATVYLPDAIYKYKSSNRTLTIQTQELRQWAIDRPSGGSGSPGTLWVPSTYMGVGSWEPRETSTEPWPLPNKLGKVPVVPLTNRPRLGRQGESEIQRVIPVQDLINKFVADMTVGSEYVSFPQRWATGIEIPKDPATGQPVNDLVAAVSRIWTSENPQAKFGSLAQISLDGFVKVIEMLVQHVASQTRTPPHYFYLSGHFPSGESIKSAETGLVAKARTKMLHYGEAWEEVIRLAFACAGNPKATEVASETIWRDPESRTESEHIAAVVQKLALGVPQEQLWEDAGYSPSQIARFKNQLIEQMRWNAQLTALNPAPPMIGPDGKPLESPTQQAVVPETVPGAPIQPVEAPSRIRLT